MKKGLGSGENGELTFLDTIAIASFLISMQNLDLNLTQEDKQELEEQLTNKINTAIGEIHEHLQQQDKKINEILALLTRQQQIDFL